MPKIRSYEDIMAQKIRERNQNRIDNNKAVIEAMTTTELTTTRDMILEELKFREANPS